MSGGRLGWDERALLVVAAKRFYLEDRSKMEIAEEFGISPFMVGRLLKRARETGIVTITVHDEAGSPSWPGSACRTTG